MLAEHEVVGSPEERIRLVQVYEGNPLALKIVAETIADLFGGEIDPFLTEGTTIFGSIAEVLDEQWERLSSLEQTVLRWLAIVREPVTIDELLAMLAVPMPRIQALEAVDSLHRRSLIERGKRQASFTLQAVVLEYVTAMLIEEATKGFSSNGWTAPRVWIGAGWCQGIRAAGPTAAAGSANTHAVAQHVPVARRNGGAAALSARPIA